MVEWTKGIGNSPSLHIDKMLSGMIGLDFEILQKLSHDFSKQLLYRHFVYICILRLAKRKQFLLAWWECNHFLLVMQMLTYSWKILAYCLPKCSTNLWELKLGWQLFLRRQNLQNISHSLNKFRVFETKIKLILWSAHLKRCTTAPKSNWSCQNW